MITRPAASKWFSFDRSFMWISLRARVAILVCTSVILIVGVKSVFDLQVNAAEREHTMYSRLETVATMQGGALVRPLWDFDLEQVKAILNTVAEEPSFVSATVIGPDAKLIAQRRNEAATPEGLSAGQWFFQIPIVFKDGARREPLGLFKLTFSKAELQAAWLQDVFRSLLVALAVALAVILAVLVSVRLVMQQLKSLFHVMQSVVAGDNDIVVPNLDRSDEVGAVAQAIDLFRKAAIERQQMERQRQSASAQQAMVVSALADGLAELARGNLAYSLERDLGGDYERLGADFDTTVRQLRDVVGIIYASTHDVRAGANEITAAADDLCARTQHNAATLEETAAAMSSLTGAVKQTSDGATQARRLVGLAKCEANQSNGVVLRAVEAMGKIKAASNQISKIVDVIDGLTVQTNLLALNATIEAARAGSAGLGFSVVASEVRVLAQRCSRAAEQIKHLVAASSDEIDNGGSLVVEAGRAFSKIAATIDEADEFVHRISASALEQAAGISEIDTAVREMDVVTQRNAAMIEEVTYSAHNLSQKMKDLSALIGHFCIDAQAERRGAHPREDQLEAA